MKLIDLDYDYLKGTWIGVKGAAFNVVAEDCKNAGYGYYGDPTEAGRKAMEEYARANL